MDADYFEFMDERWVPHSLRLTLRDALDCALSAFRKPSYYDRVSSTAFTLAQTQGLRLIVELGAGSAPLTRRLAMRWDLPDDVQLVITDLNPDSAAYGRLERQHPQKVQGHRAPVDFLKPLPFANDALLVFSASFHHIPRALRRAVLMNVRSHQVLIAEPITRNMWVMLSNVLLIVPVLFTPLWGLLTRSDGHFRRLFWCWVLPLAAPCLIWDGVISCLRCWTVAEWEAELKKTLPAGVISQRRSDSTGLYISWPSDGAATPAERQNKSGEAGAGASPD